jgi:hypothetical protein
MAHISTTTFHAARATIGSTSVHLNVARNPTAATTAADKHHNATDISGGIRR